MKFKKKNLNFQVSNLREASGGCSGQYSGAHREHALLSQLSEAYTFLALVGSTKWFNPQDLFSFPVPLKLLFNLSLRNSQQPSSRWKFYQRLLSSTLQTITCSPFQGTWVKANLLWHSSASQSNAPKCEFPRCSFCSTSKIRGECLMNLTGQQEDQRYPQI